MKVKKDVLGTLSLGLGKTNQSGIFEVDPALVQSNQTKMQSYINVARDHLESVKQEIYQIIDQSSYSTSLLAGANIEKKIDLNLKISENS